MASVLKPTNRFLNLWIGESPTIAKHSEALNVSQTTQSVNQSHPAYRSEHVWKAFHNDIHHH